MWKVQMGALHVLEEPLNTSDAHDTSLAAVSASYPFKKSASNSQIPRKKG